MTDEERVVGATDASTAEQLAGYLPLSLIQAAQPCQRSVVIAATPHFVQFVEREECAECRKYIVTQDDNYLPPRSMTNVELITCPTVLAQMYESNYTELNVIGGHEIFRFFLPLADELTVVETAWRIPGDIIFDEWEDGSFRIARVQPWDGGKTIHYERTKKKLTASRNRIKVPAQ